VGPVGGTSMKKRLTAAEHDRLLAQLREVEALQEEEETVHQQIRRLLGCRTEATVESDRIFDMVFNGEDVDETLQLLGVEVVGR
jgi:hypothetical protein